MKAHDKFIQSALKTAARDLPALPWERGTRRALSIARRKGRLRAPRATA